MPYGAWDVRCVQIIFCAPSIPGSALELYIQYHVRSLIFSIILDKGILLNLIFYGINIKLNYNMNHNDNLHHATHNLSAKNKRQH